LPLAGCRTASETDGHVDFLDPAVVWTPGGLDLTAGVTLEPTPAMLEALDRGVTITFLVAIRASSGQVWLPGFDQRRRHRFRISYLPLIRHYELEDLHNGTRSTYPRLSMLLGALREPRDWFVPLEPGDDVSLVRARIRLDRTRLPSPMRLPTWFEPQWRLDSDWQSLVPPERPGGRDDR
jgi:hypothetical protein